MSDERTKRRRAKRKLHIVVQSPDMQFRFEVTGDDRTMASEKLDAWEPVCDRIMDVINAHLCGATGEPMDTDTCVCGHVIDEHSRSGECQVNGCLCGCFEPKESDDA